MKLFLVKQDANRDYDTYRSFVIADESEDIARNIHPKAGTSVYFSCTNEEAWAAGYKYGV